MSPYRSPHPCRHLGCPALAQSGESYCSAHKVEHKQDYARKNPELQDFYNHPRWVNYRKQFLIANPLCINYNICHHAASVVDHIIDHKGNEQLFWDPANHQPMCKQCHDSKTAKTRGWGK